MGDFSYFNNTYFIDLGAHITQITFANCGSADIKILIYTLHYLVFNVNDSIYTIIQKQTRILLHKRKRNCFCIAKTKSPNEY